MAGFVPPSVTHQPLGSRGSVGDQAMVNHKHMFIDFYHIATGKCVSFKGFVKAFDDQYQANWRSDQVYGRMDPIMTYQGTQRTISIAWDIVAVSLEEAQSNLHRIEHLMSMLYPVYNSGRIPTIQASPLMKIKFANMIRQADATGETPYAAKGGLVGAVSALNYSPTFEPGFFMPGQGQLYPKSVSMNLQFTVLHTHPLGFDQKSRWRGDGKGKGGLTAFPYGTDDLTGNYSKCKPGGERVNPKGNVLISKKKKKKGGKKIRKTPGKIAAAAVSAPLASTQDRGADISKALHEGESGAALDRLAEPHDWSKYGL